MKKFLAIITALLFVAPAYSSFWRTGGFAGGFWSSFHPANLSTADAPMAWFDCGDNATITEVSGDIDAITSKITTGLTYTAPNSGARLDISTDSYGRQVCDANGTTDLLRGNDTAKAFLNGKNGFTFWVVAKADTIASEDGLIYFSTNGSTTNAKATLTRLSYAINVAGRRVSADSEDSWLGSATFQKRAYVGTGYHIYAVSVDYQNNTATTWRDGYKWGVETSHGTNGAMENLDSLDTTLFSEGNSNLWAGEVDQIYMRAGPTSDEDMASMNAYLETALGRDILVNRVIIAFGDSIIATSPDGVFTSHPHYKLWKALGEQSTDLVIHEAVSGWDFDDVLTNIATINSFGYPAGSSKLVLLHAGTNDIATQGDTPAQAKTDYDAVIAAMDSGITVYASTPIARTGEPTDLTTLGDLIVASPGTGMVAINTHEVNEFDAEADTADTTYYNGDATHPTNDGVNILADKWAGGIGTTATVPAGAILSEFSNRIQTETNVALEEE